jgi:Flp pilus assembly pilin Flp
MSDILLRAAARMQVAGSDLRNREDGQTTTEYAILLGFLAIAIIVAILLLRDEIQELFSDAASSVGNAPGGPYAVCLAAAGGARSDGCSGLCAPARLPPRPGRRIRFGGTPFRNRVSGGTMRSCRTPREPSTGEGDEGSCLHRFVPIGEREVP